MPTSANASATASSEPSIAPGRGVVVDDEGHAVPGAFQRCCQGRQPHQFRVQGAVQLPPYILKFLVEIHGRHGRCRHAPGQRRIGVVVAAGEGAGHQLAMAIQYFILFVQVPALGNIVNEKQSAVSAAFHLDVAAAEFQRPPVDMYCIAQINAHFFFSRLFMGNWKRRTPSNWYRALATAAAVGTRPISPTPLAP